MNAIKPLKRSSYLKPLSRDHHHGLLLCWKISVGFKRNIPIDRIKRYTDWFWREHLVSHFNIEEQYMFPILGTQHKYVKRALAEHRRLKRLFEQQHEAWRSLSLIEEELDSHIRFEERVLFNEIQQLATPAQLKTIAKNHGNDPHCIYWEDKFWDNS